MTNNWNTPAINDLKQAFAERRLTLFLGAGVSVANGLPTWEKLVLSLYFATIGEQKMDGWRPYSNYLYAISEWYLRHSDEPLEITARKVGSFYEDSPAGKVAFLDAIRDAIYGVETYMNPEQLLAANATLKAAVKLCRAKHCGHFGVRSVITYNYDNLLEMTLGARRAARAVYSKHCDISGKMPIFHVHGYVPYGQDCLDEPNEIIFTEEQYNLVASDPYSWSNIVQLKEMSSSVGLMIGLSLADRNIRRLLDALSQSPVKPELFALLRRPQKTTVSDKDTETIHKRAIEILEWFERSGVKGENIAQGDAGFVRPNQHSDGIKTASAKPARQAGRKTSAKRKGSARRKGETKYSFEIRGIIEQVERLEQTQQENILQQLGIMPIWFDEFEEIPRILKEIYKTP